MTTKSLEENHSPYIVKALTLCTLLQPALKIADAEKTKYFLSKNIYPKTAFLTKIQNE